MNINQCKGSMSPLVDEERIRPSQWLQLVLCAHFDALTLTAGWQERHLAGINSILLISSSCVRGRPKGEQADPDSDEITATNESSTR